MTRWHEDDLVARLQKTEGDRVLTINIPCEAEEDDVLLREPGDALGVELGKGNAWLADFKKVYMTKEGSRVWNSLFQGQPTAAEGELFKRAWFKFYSVRPDHFDEVIQSWDCSFKDSDGSDYVAGQVWGRIGVDCYLLDRVKRRMDLPATCAAIMSMTDLWPQAHAKLVEDKANGPAVIQLLQTTISGLIPIEPDGGKITRAHAVSPSFESGHVYLPDTLMAPWVVEYIDEMCAFPNGTNDDEVDSTTQALNRLIYNKSHRERPEDPPKDHEEELRRRVLENVQRMANANKKGGYSQI